MTVSSKPKGYFGGLIPPHFFRSHSPLVTLVAFICGGATLASFYSLRTLLKNPDIQPNRFKADPHRMDDQFDKGSYKFIDHHKNDPIVPYRITRDGELKETKK